MRASPSDAEYRDQWVGSVGGQASRAEALFPFVRRFCLVVFFLGVVRQLALAEEAQDLAHIRFFGAAP
jgi:hypothetical protein